MSLRIFCEKCGSESFCEPNTFNFQYDLDGLIVPLALRWEDVAFGWCGDCKTVVRVEPNLNAGRLEREIRETQNQIEGLKSRILDEQSRFRLIGKASRISQLEYESDQLQGVLSQRIAELEVSDTMNKRRRSGTRCLTCFRTRIERVQLPESTGSGDKYLGFLHPNCGGRLRVGQGMLVTRSGQLPFRNLDMEGMPVERNKGPSKPKPRRISLIQLAKTLCSASEDQQAAVGYGINMANSFLVKRFGGVSEYLDQSVSVHDEFTEQLQSFREMVSSKDKNTAIGVQIFIAWIKAVAGSEDDRAAILENAMDHLSRAAPMAP
jgi:hypothetical protein